MTEDNVQIQVEIDEELYDEIVKAWKKLEKPKSFADFVSELIRLGLERYKKGDRM